MLIGFLELFVSELVKTYKNKLLILAWGGVEWKIIII